jgi:putative membrane protein
MKQLKRWFLVLLMLLVVLLSAGFSLWNTTLVPLSFGFFDFAPRPVAVWLILAFSLGGIVGLLLGAGLIRDIKLRKRIRSLEQELDKRPRFAPSEREI